MLVQDCGAGDRRVMLGRILTAPLQCPASLPAVVVAALRRVRRATALAGRLVTLPQLLVVDPRRRLCSLPALLSLTWLANNRQPPRFSSLRCGWVILFGCFSLEITRLTGCSWL